MSSAITQKNNQRRPAVVCIMGHIDHGKSTLLDYIRNTNFTDKEAGGITQHIGAYDVVVKDSRGQGQKITFLDTPGHEAFIKTRQRGANAADIAVVVVSAEDGVMPQTKEAIKCVKESGIPFIIAITKIDKLNADIERTKQSLAENEIYVEGYGGDVPVVPVSAKTGAGVLELLELILIVAEMEGLSGDPQHPAEGLIIESNVHKTKGITATLIIKNGTLKKGEFVVAQDAFSPVRSISDWRGTKKDYAQMGESALVTGWNKLPQVGIPFFTVKERKMAEKMIEEYANNKKNETDITTEVNTADRQVDVVIPIIIKADVIGSLEAIKHEINKIRVPRVAFKTLLEGVGSISENDAKNASVFPGSLILGFNVEIDNRAQILIERNHIECKTFKIIYELTEFLKKVAEERRPREIVEKVVGKVKILKVFQKEKDRHILGGKVTEGSIKIGDEFRLVRRDNELCRGKIRELQRQKNKVEEIVAATECGILAQAEKAISEGDILEVFIKEEI